MTASALLAANAAPAALSALAGQAGNVPLTRVSLAYLEHRFKLLQALHLAQAIKFGAGIAALTLKLRIDRNDHQR